jgi:hypothetical protein
MGGVDQKRAIISAVYTGPAWKDKVAKMADNQVIAIYNDFLARDLIGRVVEYTPPTGMDRLVEIIDDDFDFDKDLDELSYEQLNLFDQLEDFEIGE